MGRADKSRHLAASTPISTSLLSPYPRASRSRRRAVLALPDAQSRAACVPNEHHHSSRKIDLATAAVIAHDRAAEQKPFRSVHEDRGMLVFGGD